MNVVLNAAFARAFVHLMPLKPDEPSPEATVCTSCPVQCRIPVGCTGACKRYTNEDGRLCVESPVGHEERPLRQ